MTLKPAALLCAILALSPITGCVFSSGPLTASDPYMASTTTGSAASAPIINAFDYSPKQVTKDSAVTFTVVAASPLGHALQYNWAATKGVLSTNSGQAVNWRPVKADGSLDAGIATITVIISDGANTTTGTLNINVAADGTITTAASAAPSSAPSTAASTTPSPAPTASATATPTPAPSASASTAATGAASPSPSASASADTAATSQAGATSAAAASGAAQT